MSIASWIYVGALIIGIILFICYSKTKKFFKCLFFTAFTGLGGLGVVWLLGKFVAVKIAVTPLTMLLSATLGIPGVAVMLLIHLI